jgi:hypothetical protein
VGGSGAPVVCGSAVNERERTRRASLYRCARVGRARAVAPITSVLGVRAAPRPCVGDCGTRIVCDSVVNERERTRLPVVRPSTLSSSSGDACLRGRGGELEHHHCRHQLMGSSCTWWRSEWPVEESTIENGHSSSWSLKWAGRSLEWPPLLGPAAPHGPCWVNGRWWCGGSEMRLRRTDRSSRAILPLLSFSFVRRLLRPTGAQPWSGEGRRGRAAAASGVQRAAGSGGGPRRADVAGRCAAIEWALRMRCTSGEQQMGIRYATTCGGGGDRAGRSLRIGVARRPRGGVPRGAAPALPAPPNLAVDTPSWARRAFAAGAARCLVWPPAPSSSRPNY